MAKSKPGQPCAFDPCERPAYCKGLCVRHYEQQNEGKPLTPIRPKRKQQPDRCEVEGCERTPTRRGMCPMHNHRVDTHGDPGGPDSWWRSGCQVEGCENRHAAHGFCATHLRRHNLYGDPTARWMPRKCKTPGCEHPAVRGSRGQGFCAGCFLRWWTTEYLAGNVQATRSPADYEYVSIGKTQHAVHRLVMERVIGRPLFPFETPHHRNGIHHDNRPENLELWTKPQPAGQRPEDLAAWVVEFYPEVVAAALAAA